MKKSKQVGRVSQYNNEDVSVVGFTIYIFGIQTMPYKYHIRLLSCYQN